jgi:hypothetical protein
MGARLSAQGEANPSSSVRTEEAKPGRHGSTLRNAARLLGFSSEQRSQSHWGSAALSPISPAPPYSSVTCAHGPSLTAAGSCERAVHSCSLGGAAPGLRAE